MTVVIFFFRSHPAALRIETTEITLVALFCETKIYIRDPRLAKVACVRETFTENIVYLLVARRRKCASRK